MTDYTKTTNFAAKDALVSGNPAKVVKGTEVNTEFDNIATAVATKANLAGPTFTGTTTAANLTVSGTFTGTIDGGTY
jgi:cytoskeletal protein CcmA (bactofilin family)|tara:strand:+ start:620 stop:850 length:231 start_codon:yes stop_codon:yes gene_type:complete